MTTETDTANVRPAEEPAAVAVFPAVDKLTAQNNSFTTITTLSTSFSSSCNSLDLSAAVEHNSSRSNNNTRDSSRNNHQSSSKSILIDTMIDAAPEEEEEGGGDSSAYLSLSSSSLQQNRRSRGNQQSGGAIKHFRGVLTTWEEQERAIVAARRGRTGRSQKSSIKDRMRLFESTSTGKNHQRGRAPAAHAASMLSVSSSHLLSRSNGSSRKKAFEPSRQSSCPDLNSKVTTAAKPPLPTASRRSDGNASSSSLQLDEIARNGPNATPRRAPSNAAEDAAVPKSIPNNRRTGGRKAPEKEPKERTGEKEPTQKTSGEKESKKVVVTKQREPKNKTKSGSGRLRGVLIPLEEQQRAIVQQRASKKKRHQQQGGNNIRLAPRSPRPSSVKDRRVMFESKGPVRFHESMPSMVSFGDANDDDDSSTCSLDVNSIHSLSLCDDPTLRGRLQALEDSLSGSMLDLGANGGIQDDHEHNNEQEQSLQSFWNSSRSILSLPNNESFSHEQQ